MCRLLVAGVAEDVLEGAGGGAGRDAHHAVNVRPFEVQAGVGHLAHFAVMEDDTALALVHGVHTAAGGQQQDENGDGADNEGDEGGVAFLAHGRSWVVG